eukprot:scaffold248391_cov70-Cyclotella_meneghiniana.AAC.14
MVVPVPGPVQSRGRWYPFLFFSWCEPPLVTCPALARTPITSQPNLAYLSKSSLTMPTFAVKVNDFSSDIGQPTAHVIHLKTYRDE